MQTYDEDDIKVARLSVSEVIGITSITDMHYIIAEKNKKIKYYKDKHEMGLFEVRKTLGIMKNFGFKAKFLRNGLMKNRGLFIGVKN